MECCQGLLGLIIGYARELRWGALGDLSVKPGSVSSAVDLWELCRKTVTNRTFTLNIVNYLPV